jgi:hypothetical protein
MKRFMLLHIGFEKPTPEIMAAWGAWFDTVAEHTVENAGLRGGREISRDGVRDLPWDANSLTGYTIVRAESIQDAERLAQGNPFITGIRIYEIAAH